MSIRNKIYTAIGIVALVLSFAGFFKTVENTMYRINYEKKLNSTRYLEIKRFENMMMQLKERPAVYREQKQAIIYNNDNGVVSEVTTITIH